MSHDEAVAIIKKHSGRDITSGLAITGSKGEWPLTGIYWAFKDYDAIIGLFSREGKVTELTYWTKKDFGESKSHRAQTEQNIKALKIDTGTREVSIEKTKRESDAN